MPQYNFKTMLFIKIGYATHMIKIINKTFNYAAE